MGQGPGDEVAAREEIRTGEEQAGGDGEAAIARLDRAGPVATIILDRPGRLNAIDVALARRLKELAREAAADPDMRVLVIRGAGPAFCAGGDVRMFAARLDDIDAPIQALLTELHQFLLALRSMKALVIASVHGIAAGAGLSLCGMTDLCIAEEGTRFRAAYAPLGVTPDGGGTFGLVEQLGPRRALQLFLADDEIDVEAAHLLGLVTRIAPAGRLEEETARLADRIAALGPEVVAGTKRLVYRSAGASLEDQLEAELAQLVRCMKTDLFRERALAFGRGPAKGENG